MNNAFDSILGCLYGQAIGDALGMPSELWPLSRVRQHFGWIDQFLPGPEENCAAVGFHAGEYTDDTQQAVALMEALIAEQGKIVPQRIAANIMQWAERINAFEKNILGPTSKSALLALRNGDPIESITANGTTNGAAMRVAPLGCLLSTRHPDEFINSVAVACSPTHKSDIAIAGAVTISWAISRAIEDASWQVIKEELPVIAQRAQEWKITTFSPSLSRRIQWGYELTQGLQNASPTEIIDTIYHSLGAGMETIESIPAAIALVDITAGDPVQCATLAANLGGDTDTIGAMATAICGALKGIQALPASWVKTINEANSIDFKNYATELYSLRFNEVDHEPIR